jgi:phosphinothricin acetyltransferase
MTEADWPQVVAIYREGIETGTATFEAAVPPYEAWDAAHVRTCRLVALIDAATLGGWAVLSPTSSRRAYRGVAEVSIYVGEKHRGQNVGRLLLEALVEASEKEGFWTLQSGVFEQNAASLALHIRCGFRLVGFRERIARDTSGTWRNTLLLERRSARVGLD